MSELKMTAASLGLFVGHALETWAAWPLIAVLALVGGIYLGGLR